MTNDMEEASQNSEQLLSSIADSEGTFIGTFDGKDGAPSPSASTESESSTNDNQSELEDESSESDSSSESSQQVISSEKHQEHSYCNYLVSKSEKHRNLAFLKASLFWLLFENNIRWDKATQQISKSNFAVEY